VNRLVEDWMQGREAPRHLRVTIAAALSGLVFPGLGQMYNRQFRKGLLFAAAAAVSAAFFVFGAASGVLQAVSEGSVLEPVRVLAVAEKVVADDGGAIAGVALAMMVTWIAATVDAYLVARRPRPGERYD
jgi:hypothetical protein